MTPKLIVSFLLMCLLSLSSTVSVHAKGNLVRGAHAGRTLKKHTSMAARRLMKDEEGNDKNKDKDEEDEVAAAEEDDKDNNDEDDKEQDDDEDEEEETEAPVVEEVVEAPEEVVDETVETPEEPTVEEPAVEEPAVEEPVVEDVAEEVDPAVEVPVGNATEAVGPDEEFSVALDPFSLTVDGAVTEEDLDLETYLFNYMVTFMPNLVSIDLDSETIVDGQITEEESSGNSTRRMLRAEVNTERSLVVQTFYYEGNASFVGPPMRSHDEVDAALTYALEDTQALQEHLEATFPSANVAIDVGDDPMAVGATSEEQEKSEETGLSTTGLSIVIVAACVGGISLLIIIMVGISGPSNDASGMKGGLPEQPRS